MQTIYKEIVNSKTGFKIPVLANGKTIESRYNPEIDVERKIQSIKKDDLFYLIIGLGSGLLVSKLLEENKVATVLVVENSKEDLDFLKSFPRAKEIIDMGIVSAGEKNGEHRAKICLKEDLEKTLPLFYIPALHGNLNIIEQPNYLSVDSKTHDFIKSKINSALKSIMADFSVQAHFGKIWQRNIMENLSIYKKIDTENFPTEKIAVVLAAGPTLDLFFEKYSCNREKYFLIATDTAFSSSIKNGIVPDAVVSIDGQLVSENHFLHKISDETMFVFDLCANSSAVKKVFKWTDNILFTESGHPLAKFASLTSHCNESKIKTGDCFLNLFSGSGTVTIAAVDFAMKVGFSKIEIIGADFSYKNGKPYAKGTYLDNIYNKNSNRISTSETGFSKLMYRTELIKLNENSFTTTVLESYKKSLEDYLVSSKIAFKNKNNIYYLSLKNENKKTETFFKAKEFQFDKSLSNSKSVVPSTDLDKTQCFSYSRFCKLILSIFESLDLSKTNYSVSTTIPPLILSVLPYIAFLRLKNTNLKLQEMLKLALINLLRYNKDYEKK